MDVPGPELMKKYTRPGPRYTSYPTAVEFEESFDGEAYGRKLAEADALGDSPLSLYVHLPFCSERCAFCGCHVIATRREDVAEKYLGYLGRELDLLAERLPHRRRICQISWGGGTPTYLNVPQIEALYQKILERFTLEPDAEVAIELDPRVTRVDQLEALKRLGFNRLSMGVQDFTPQVQQEIGRHQTEAQTRELYRQCRDLGFESVNFDLVYGLPGQSEATFDTNLEAIVDLRPDRLALYSYAHLPKMRPNQRRIDESLLPGPKTKLGLFLLARRRLLEAGYVTIGMDHFAVPEDEMVAAQKDGRLGRNFMGYTVRKGGDQIAAGISAIADVRGGFAQNYKKLPHYYTAIDEGRLPVERGRALDADDLIRRDVIEKLMCNFRLDPGEIERAHGIRFADYFQHELAALEAPGGPEEDGLIEIGEKEIRAVGHGRFLIRNLCMVFDAYLAGESRKKSTFSSTV